MTVPCSLSEASVIDKPTDGTPKPKPCLFICPFHCLLIHPSLTERLLWPTYCALVPDALS